MKSDAYSHYKQELRRSEEQLQELEEKGVHALSRYDIAIASGGDAKQALKTAKMLVSNHIRYFQEKLSNTQRPLFEF
jgi:hypothetical protein